MSLVYVSLSLLTKIFFIKEFLDVFVSLRSWIKRSWNWKRWSFSDISSIGASTNVGMTEERSERRIKAGTLGFSFRLRGRTRKRRKRRKRVVSTGCLRESALTLSWTRRSLFGTKKKSAKEPMPQSVIRVALPCPLTFYGARTEFKRESIRKKAEGQPVM